MAKVLVIDDEPSIATLVAEIIEAYGHEVCTAFNGLQGLDYIKQEKFDLIVSDIMMPHVTGLELLYFIRSEGQFAGTNFVLMSAVTHLSLVGKPEQPEDFLVKPFDITRIDELVQKFLPEPDKSSFIDARMPLNFPIKNHYENSRNYSSREYGDPR